MSGYTLLSAVNMLHKAADPMISSRMQKCSSAPAAHLAKVDVGTHLHDIVEPYFAQSSPKNMRWSPSIQKNRWNTTEGLTAADLADENDGGHHQVGREVQGPPQPPHRPEVQQLQHKHVSP